MRSNPSNWGLEVSQHMGKRVRWESFIVTLTAILCITVLEVIALLKGIDGQVYSTVLAVLAGLGGYTIGRSTSGGEKQ